MDELDRNLLDAWHRVFARCKADPKEARKRYQRTLPGTCLDRPVRAWCVALRASDTRMDAIEGLVPSAVRAQMAHEIVVDGELLKLLGGAVSIPYPGVPIDEAAKRLGKHKESLRHWLVHKQGRTRATRAQSAWGVGHDDRTLAWDEHPPTDERPLGVRYVPQRVLKRGGNGPGMETPVVWSAYPLDPGAAKGRPPSRWWGTLWQSLADGVPDAFEQVIERAPRFVPYPEIDGRKRPRFRGWRWVCPGLSEPGSVGPAGCGRQVATLYAPLPIWTVGQYMDMQEGLDVEGLAGQWYPGVMDRWAGRRRLACEQCWKLRRTSFANYRGWNELVSYLSGGLLYGHEVQKPAEFEYERQWAYTPRRRKPSKEPHNRVCAEGVRRLPW